MLVAANKFSEENSKTANAYSPRTDLRDIQVQVAAKSISNFANKEQEQRRKYRFRKSFMAKGGTGLAED